MTIFLRTAGAASLLAAAAMAATPAVAAELPVSVARSSIPAATGWDSAAHNAANHRQYRYRRHRSADAGDVIGTVLVLGGIAAIAGAVANSEQNDGYRYRERSYPYRGDYRDRPYQYRPYRGDSRYTDSRGIDRAVEMCVSAVERDARVESVDSVDRLIDGWRVAGSIYNGEGFSCRIGNDGRIDDVDYGPRRWNGADTGAAADRQWSDEDYAAARRDQEAQPAYPGGPVEGDIVDDRYEAAQAPDFGD